MGYYTELKFKATLKENTPPEIINLLKRVIIEGDLGIGDAVFFSSDEVFKPEFDHKFLKCERWYMMLISNDFGTTNGSKMFQQNGLWIIDLHTSFKNYDQEIDHFVNWISPYIIGHKKKKYVGWWRGEEMNYQINIYIERK